MPDDVVDRLVDDGLLARDQGRVRTTPRWQAAMARAALRLQQAGAPWQDLRLPIASALLDFYASLPDPEIARYVETLLPIEALGMPPLLRGTTAHEVERGG